MTIDLVLRHYQGLIISLANSFYNRLPPSKLRFLDKDDLIQVARITIWQIWEKHPEQLANDAYVFSALRQSIIQATQKYYFKCVDCFDCVSINQDDFNWSWFKSTNNDHVNQQDCCIESLNALALKFSAKDLKSISAFLKKFFWRSDFLPSANLALEPKILLLIAKMDLTDADMLEYALVLSGAKNRFSPNMALGEAGQKRCQKYLRFLLSALNMSGEDLAILSGKLKFFEQYRLIEFYRRGYGHNMIKMITDSCPTVKPFMIKINSAEKRWLGGAGLKNIQLAVYWIATKTGKSVTQLRKKDLADFGLGGLHRQIFSGCTPALIECAVPGSFPQYTNRVQKIILALGAK